MTLGFGDEGLVALGFDGPRVQAFMILGFEC